jgi:hypothetical protein
VPDLRWHRAPTLEEAWDALIAELGPVYVHFLPLVDGAGERIIRWRVSWISDTLHSESTEVQAGTRLEGVLMLLRLARVGGC